MKEYLTEVKECYKRLFSRELFYEVVEAYGPIAVLHPVGVILSCLITPFSAYYIIRKSK